MPVIRPAAFALAAAAALLVSPCDASESKAAIGALQLAKHHYSKGNFLKAARLFLEAHELDPRPVFLYNAGRSYQRALKFDAAEKHYRACLAMKGVAKTLENRARMYLQEIAAIKSAFVRKEGAPAAPPKAETGPPKAETGPPKAETGPPKPSARPGPTAAPPKSSPAPTAALQPPAAGAVARTSWRGPAGWGAAGGGALLLAGAGWVLSAWRTDQQALDAQMADKGPDGKVVGIHREAYVSEQERLNSQLNLGAAIAAVGVVAAGAGVWLLATRDESATVALTPGPGLRGLGAVLRF